MNVEDRAQFATDDVGAALPTYDDTVLIAMVDGDAQLAAEIVAEFDAVLLSVADEIAAAFAGGHIEVLTVAAHRLKSSSRTVGAMRLGELCDRLEDAANAGSPDLVRRLIAAVTAEVDAVAKRLPANGS
jgi:HPt (histidine-containing phosphotransfer) domain-containing protein